jgi:hypothetical protein
MINKLSEYLILNEKASLPGIGTFSAENTHAKLDFINSKFYPPLPEILFSSGIAETDKDFFNFISGNAAERSLAAERRFNDVIFDIKHKLSYKGEVVFDNLGTLKKNTEGNYSFEKNFSIEDFFPPVAAIRISRNYAQPARSTAAVEYVETETKNLTDEDNSAKDHWLVYAVILTAIGIAALTYYYYGSFAN